MLALFLYAGTAWTLHAATPGVFNVKNFGATARKTDDGRAAIQKAIDTCAGAGGGTVYFPPGEYTSGTLHLRSNVRIEIDAGATVFGSPEPKDYDCGTNLTKAALFFGEGITNVTLAGRGTVDGQAEYAWRLDEFDPRWDHMARMQAAGKPLWRSFPKGHPERELYPHLLWLGHASDVRVTGLKFLHAFSWTMALYDCERVWFDDLYIYTSLKEAVWADGIDLDGCRKVTVANCRIETGDDCIIFISEDRWGKPLPCEDIVVTNCRLSSASAGIKFSEGNWAGIRRVLIKDNVLTNVNRGLVFTSIRGGDISDVVISNLDIDCSRFDWFWAGDGQPFHARTARVSEVDEVPPKPNEPPPGLIHNIQIRNVVARCKGSSLLRGHPESWLEGFEFEHVKLFLTSDTQAPYDQATNAFTFRWARNIKLKDVEVHWGSPGCGSWQQALCFDHAQGVTLEGFRGGSAPSSPGAAVVFNQVQDALVRRCAATAGTGVFLQLLGSQTREVWLQENEFGEAKAAYGFESDGPGGKAKR